jgi:Domain of unknown function (DUF3859)
MKRARTGMRALLACALFLVACSAAARAQAPDAQQAEIQWAGVFRARVVGTIEQPDTAIGRTNQLAGIEKLQTTTTVPARLGVSFGLEYRLSAVGGAGAATIQVVIIPPKAGLLNPANPRRIFRETWRPSSVPIGAPTLIGYRLEHDWEIVPGLWRFEIWHGERKLGEQSFCLVPDQNPGSSEESRKAQADEYCHSAATA